MVWLDAISLNPETFKLPASFSATYHHHVIKGGVVRRTFLVRTLYWNEWLFLKRTASNYKRPAVCRVVPHTSLTSTLIKHKHTIMTLSSHMKLNFESLSKELICHQREVLNALINSATVWIHLEQLQLFSKLNTTIIISISYVLWKLWRRLWLVANLGNSIQPKTDIHRCFQIHNHSQKRRSLTLFWRLWCSLGVCWTIWVASSEWLWPLAPSRLTICPWEKERENACSLHVTPIMDKYFKHSFF